MWMVYTYIGHITKREIWGWCTIALPTLSRFSLVGGMLVHQLGFINPELNFTCFFSQTHLVGGFNCEPKFSTPILRWLRPHQSLQSPGCEILTCSAYSHMFSSGSPSESWSNPSRAENSRNRAGI